MSHFTWTYVGDVKRNHRVGLFHGNKTGHLLIYCNAKIILIDFRVRDSKKYSFFINDELCEIRLERKGGKMFYYFEINKEADTPRNRARRKMERKYFGQTLLFFGGFALVLTLFLVGMNQFKNQHQKDRQAILDNGQKSETVGMVRFDSAQNLPIITYFFVANNRSYSAAPSLEATPLMVLDNGMPLESGDEFMVEYLVSNPEINRIKFDRPSEKQLQTYRRLIIEKYRTLHPQLSGTKVNCLLNVAFQLKGLEGFADFYFQDVSPQKNPSHNHLTFLRLTQDLAFKKVVAKSCLIGD